MIRTLRAALAAALLSVPLAACVTIDPNRPVTPGSITRADTTTLDERGTLGITLAYTAASKGAALAIRLARATRPFPVSTEARIAELDRRAYNAAVAAERAYRTGNAASFAIANEQAKAAVAALVAAY